MIEMAIGQRRRDPGGGLAVDQLSPFANRRLAGPFIVFDRMGPLNLAPEAERGRDGRRLVEGKKVNDLTNTDEEAVGLIKGVPFLFENGLEAKGGISSQAHDRKSWFVQNDVLITGQSPASSAAARRLAEALIASTSAPMSILPQGRRGSKPAPGGQGVYTALKNALQAGHHG